MNIRTDWENSAHALHGQIRRAFGELAEEPPVNANSSESELIDWLSRLCLLDNVPFHYLIPSDLLLPDNAIRLFYINPNWQRALVDGACSLGRNASIDLDHDRQLINTVFSQIGKQVKTIRPRLQKKELAPEEAEEEVQVIGGFILRSPLVRGWRGLEFQALSADGELLRALRIENLSDDVLIGLFDGVPYTLKVAQPPESFYFGFNHINGNYSKRLRSFETGALLANTDTVEVVMQDTKMRTIDICATARNIENFFHRPVTSAEFALQMIKTPYIGQVVRTDNES
ncbi:hypothetical protein [Paenibacillus sp. Z6-24]